MAAGQLTLQADTEVDLPRDAEIRLDRVDRPEHRLGRRPAGKRAGQVAVLDRHGWHERRQVDLREDDVPFRLVVEDAKAPPQDRGGTQRVTGAVPWPDED